MDVVGAAGAPPPSGLPHPSGLGGTGRCGARGRRRFAHSGLAAGAGAGGDRALPAAAGAGSEAEFFARLDRAGVLARQRFSTKTPRQRFSTKTPGQVTGYAVALPGDTAKDGGPVWYSGGKLAADLTWPKLRQRWTQPRTTRSGEQLTAADQKATWEHAAQVAADATARIRTLAGSNLAAAADAAWAASDTLLVAAAVLDSPALRQAADAYDRAARAPYGRIPLPSP